MCYCILFTTYMYIKSTVAVVLFDTVLNAIGYIIYVVYIELIPAFHEIKIDGNFFQLTRKTFAEIV